MKSYIKIYGPPIYEAIKALEKVAIDTPQVCIMNTIIEASAPEYGDIGTSDGRQWASGYFAPLGISLERCGSILSKSSKMLGDYDFFFEWYKKPSTADIEMLMQKIDEALSPIGCRYTITTKR